MASRKARPRRAVASGVLLSAGARRNLRFALEEGGVDAQRALPTELSRAVVQVANDVLTRKLMERARLKDGEPPSEDDIQEEANAAVRRHLGWNDNSAEGSEALDVTD
jgi:hypothetical protein